LLISEATLGCHNYKQLDGHAGKFAHKLWHRTLILESEIRDVVQRLPLRTDVDKNYFSSHNFYELWKEQRNKIQDGQFHYFANLCKRVYETCDELDKIRVFVIFSHVSDEYGRNFTLLQRSNRSRDQKPEFEHEQSFSEMMEMFTAMSSGSVPKPAKEDPGIHCDWSFQEDTLALYAKQLHTRVRTDSKPVPCDDICRGLDFVYKLGEGEKTNIARKYYCKPTTFQTYFEGVTANITGERFLTFAVTCKELYEELKDFQTRLALFLLLEKVAENENKYLLRRKVLRDQEELMADEYPLEFTI
jgi:hypothetical protein